MFAAFTAATPSRVQRDISAVDRQLADLSEIAPPDLQADSDATEPTQTSRSTPSKPLPGSARKLTRSPDENSPARPSYASQATAKASARDVQREKSRSPSPGPRGPPVGRARRPFGARAGSQPLADESLEEAQLKGRSRSPSLPPDVADELPQADEDESSSSSGSSSYVRSPYQRPRAPFHEPTASSSGTSSESNEYAIRQTAVAEQEPSSDDEEETEEVDEEDAPPLPSPVQSPAPTHAARAGFGGLGSSPLAGVGRVYREAEARRHTPVNQSRLREVVVARSTASDTSSAQSSPQRPSSPYDRESSFKRSPRTPASHLAQSLDDAQTPRAARANPMAEYVTNTLAREDRRRQESVAIKSATRARLDAAQTPRRGVDAYDEDESSELSASSITDSSEEYRRGESSLPVVLIDGERMQGGTQRHTKKAMKKLYASNLAMEGALAQKSRTVEDLQEQLQTRSVRFAQDEDAMTSVLQAAEQNSNELARRVQELEQVVEEQKEYILAKEVQYNGETSRLKDDLSNTTSEGQLRLEAGQRELDLLKRETAKRIAELERKMQVKDEELAQVRQERLELRVALEEGGGVGDNLLSNDMLQENLDEKIKELDRANSNRIREEQARERAELETEQAREAMERFQNEAAKMKEEVEMVKNQLSERIIDYDQLNDRHRQLEARHATLQNDIQMLESDRALAVEHAASPLKAETHELQTERQRLMSRVAELEVELNEARSQQIRGSPNRDQQQKLLDENSRLREERNDSQAQLSDARSDLDGLKMQYDQAVTELQRLRQEYEGENAVAGKNRVVELQAEIEALKRQARHLEKGTPLSAERKSFQFDSVRSMKTPIRAEDFLHSLLPDPLVNASPREMAMSGQIHKLNETIAGLRKELGRINARLDLKIEELEAAEAGKQEAEDALEEAEQRVRELETEADGLQSQLDESLRNLNQPTSDQEKVELRRVHMEKERIQRALDAMKSKLGRLREERDASVVMETTSAEQVRSLKARVASLEEQAEDATTARQEHSLALRKLQQLNNRCEQLSRDLASAQSANSKLEAAKAQQLDEIKGLGDDLMLVRKDADRIAAQLGARPVAQGDSSIEGVRSLMLYINYLKALCTREADKVASLVQQKIYLSNQALTNEDELVTMRCTLERYGFSHAKRHTVRQLTFKAVALSVIASIRLRKDAASWREAVQIKHDLRASWERSRGRQWGA